MRRSATLHAIVLAAGASTRFGSPKQLARINGHPLLQRVLSLAGDQFGPAVTVVLGAHAADISASLPQSSASIVINRDWQEGLASSIRAGVQRLPGACDGALILLADQPLVGAEGLRRLVTAWRRAPRQIIASMYNGVTGVPAVFPRWCFDELCALRGDQGARLILRRHADRLVRLEHPEAALDIDYPEDLLDLQL
jgi:molybdenum cofactor cytidylyltransferase